MPFRQKTVVPLLSWMFQIFGPILVNAIDCPISTTKIDGDNDIAGCGLGCTKKDSIADCRNACEAQSGCVAFSYNADDTMCTMYDSDNPTQSVVGDQVMCKVSSPPQCDIKCEGHSAILSGMYRLPFNGAVHWFVGRPKQDATSPQQFYFMTPCDHNDRHHMPFSILGKLAEWIPPGTEYSLSGLDYLTLELYDEMDTWYVWLSSGIRKYVHSGAAVSTLYDENKANGVAMETLNKGETTIANGRFRLRTTIANGRESTFLLTHVPTGCRQYILMKGTNNWDEGSGRYQMHYAKFGIPECYKCSTCGMLGDFQHECDEAKLYGCDGGDQNIETAQRWTPGTAGWDREGWTWQKVFVDGDSCQERASGAQVDEDTFCDDDVRDQVIAKCQAARDAQATCCRNIGGMFCDELQVACEINVCIAATDEPDKMDEHVQAGFTDEVEAECENQGLFGPVPKLLYEFRGDLAETMSGKAAANTLQAVGDVEVKNGALVCDGEGDFVYGTSKLGFTFSGHTLEVLVTVDDLSSKGGTIAIDGNYGSAVEAQYTHNKFDSIVYNEVGNKKWILGSEGFSRTDTSGSDTAESATNQMVHLVAVYHPDTNSAKLYRNGVEEMNYNPNGFLTSSSAEDGLRMMFCQCNFNAGWNNYKGKIMFGAVYDYALSAQDADQLYRKSIVRFDGNIIEAVGDELLPGQSLLKGQGLLSVDRRYIAAMKTDGFFVIYDLNDETVVFEAEMTAGSRATFRRNGNFVIWDTNAGKIVWHSGATDDNAANLIMGTNGNLLAIGDDDVFWNSNQHETVALPATASANNQNLNMLDWNINPKENLNEWRFKIEIPDYETMERYILYLCLLVTSLNLICGAYFCCCNKKAKNQYKVVSMMNTAAEDETTDVEMDKEDAEFLA